MATTTWNPADKAAGITLYGGNLSAYSSGSAGIVRATVARNSGKYYFEVSIFDGGYSELSFIGITTAVQSVSTYLNASGAPSFSAKASGNKYAGSVASYLNCFFALPPAIIGVAIDFDAHKIWWHQDGDWFGGNPALGTGAHFSTLVANTDYYPAFTPLNLYGAGRFSLASFGYTPPVGFLAWDIDPAPSLTQELAGGGAARQTAIATLWQTIEAISAAPTMKADASGSLYLAPPLGIVFRGELSRPIRPISRYGNSNTWYPAGPPPGYAFTANAQNVATASGAMVETIGLSGAATARVYAELNPFLILSGATAAIAAAVGSLSLAVLASGQASAASTAAGSLLVNGEDIPVESLESAVHVVATAAGELSAAIPLAATAVSSPKASGSPDVWQQLASVASVLNHAAGALQSAVSLSGAAQSQSGSVGDLHPVVQELNAVARSAAEALGAILVVIPLAAESGADSTSGGAIRQGIDLEGGASGHVSADGGIGQDVALGGSAAAQVSAAGRLAVDVPKDGGITYAVNVATGAATTLSNFAFDRLITAHNRMYGILNGTLYLVGGDTDPGDTAINATIRFAPSHYGAIGRKRLETVYCYSRELTGVLATPIYDEETGLQYITTPLNRDGMRATRAFIGRGNSWHTLGLEIRNINGGKLDIGGLEPVVSPLSRRRR